MKTENMQALLLILFVIAIFAFKQFVFEHRRKQRRDYYRNDYLKSDAWKRKRYVVLKRDNWRCVFCGGRATQVHHKKYAKYNIGKEPIEWLVSVCKSCHDNQHNWQSGNAKLTTLILPIAGKQSALLILLYFGLDEQSISSYYLTLSKARKQLRARK